MTPDPDWVVPQWQAPARVNAVITTRAGGFSAGPYASLNLGLRTGDDAAMVAKNRARLRSLLPQEPKWLRQVHGSVVVSADTVSSSAPEADSSVARSPGTVCAVLIADCVPVLLCNRAGSVVAAAHAGWRGLACGVIERTLSAIGEEPADLLAYLGPGIGPAAFEVGAEVREAFLAQASQDAAAFAPRAPGKWLADLFMLARNRLERAGLRAIFGGGMCTYSDPARFFSYRRDRTTGRMAALIWLES
ncbi:MAG TPA: peptidoglycan editing factor PgeF [Burkholderiales bacterium]|jgi:YfiH family protein|nr:peptidoglycan editing factor PgeF [Burkholderiales bacterium]